MHPLLPEVLERWRSRVSLADLFVEPSDPLVLAATLCELLAHPETLGQGGEDGVVRSGLAIGRHGPTHGDQVVVGGSSADVIALYGQRRREDDVGATGGGRPPGLVHDDGVRLTPCLYQLPEVLVVVEGIAARPVDQVDL